MDGSETRSGPRQHYLRPAFEPWNGRAVLRASSNGISALIDGKGASSGGSN